MTEVTHKGPLSKLVPSLLSHKPMISEIHQQSSHYYHPPPYTITKEDHCIVIQMTFPKTILQLADTSVLEVDEHEVDFKNDTYRYHLKLHFSDQRLHIHEIDAVYYQKSHHLYITIKTSPNREVIGHNRLTE